MFCPQCGQKQVSNEARFCSSCGLQLNAVSELLKTGGVVSFRPAGPRRLSPRQKGIRQGALMMLSTMLVVPLVAIIGVALLDLPGEVAGIAAVTCFVGGLLRIIYALMLEETEAPASDAAHLPTYAPPVGAPLYMNPPPARGAALPPPQQQGFSGADYRPPRRPETGEVIPRPPSVTENTTRLLGDLPDDAPKQ